MENSRPLLKMKKPEAKTKPAEKQHPDSVFDLIGVKSILEQLRLRQTAEIEFYALADAIRKKQQVADAAFLLKLARLAVEILNQVCHDVPQVFQPIASKEIAWPGLIGVHNDIQIWQQNLAKVIKLGANSPINVTGKTWTLRTVEARIAYNLFQRIEGRDGNPTWPPLRGNPMWPIWVKSKFDVPEPVVREIQTNLAPLSRQNYRQWWKIAEYFFLHKYGKNFEAHKDFAGYWKSKAFKDDPKAKAQIRSAIKHQIKQAFRSVARKSSAVE